MSSLLLNSEAWVNYSDKDVRILEQCDEILLTKILDCDANTSNALKYLELGIFPVRFKIMRRKIAFLQYILKEDKNSMIYQILKATEEKPIKNDFVITCQKYLKILDINLSFEEIGKMSKYSLKKVLREKTNIAAYKYLTAQKSKQTKILDMEYSKLEMQAYLADGDRDNRVSRLIFKARGKTLDIKMQKRWKYDDTLCTGCGIKEETGQEIFMCDKLNKNPENIPYSRFHKEFVKDQVSAPKVMMKKIKLQEQLKKK